MSSQSSGSTTDVPRAATHDPGADSSSSAGSAARGRVPAGAPATPPAVPGKISAYYSLVLPDFTYYVQTLNVTIGRRCTPGPVSGAGAASGGLLAGAVDGPASAAVAVSSADKQQADVDLGPLKSVSRLHARIEYDEDEERFVLIVVGRNGAWVDGVWSGSGSKVPLGERSQIQIASRTFHFVLPPPPDDSPSPSSASSPQRQRSPSVDITSFSPRASQPSYSPPPPVTPPPKQQPLPSATVDAASSNVPAPSGKGKGKGKGAGKKRKKVEVDAAPAPDAPPPAPAPTPAPPPKPEVMPPKPSLTYSQLTYRAIKALGGKATLQDICGWMMSNFDWYRLNQGAGWENSVRHNLSSGRAFKKGERCGGERGKGFFWSVDEKFEHTFEEQEAKAAAAAAAAAKGGKDGAAGARKKDKKGIPLPPPFANTPLTFKTTTTPAAPGVASAPQPTTQPHRRVPNGVVEPLVKAEAPETVFPLQPPPLPPGPGGTFSTFSVAAGVSYAPAMTTMPAMTMAPPLPAFAPPSAPVASTSAAALAPAPAAPASTSSVPPLDPAVRVPIVVGPLPASYVPPPSTSTSAAGDPFKTPPIVLHENTLILDPGVFGPLSRAQLNELERLGAQKALEILQVYIVNYLKERMKVKSARGRVRGRGRGRGAPPGATGPGRGGAPDAAAGAGQGAGTPGGAVVEGDARASPFTTAPLHPRTGSADAAGGPREGVPARVDVKPPVPVPVLAAEEEAPAMAALLPDGGWAGVGAGARREEKREREEDEAGVGASGRERAASEEIIVVDDEVDEPAVKRRRVDG